MTVLGGAREFFCAAFAMLLLNDRRKPSSQLFTCAKQPPFLGNVQVDDFIE